ncbi:hypothetical protein V8G54_027248 [Vigna mungo]|uniref:Uncharacterized protein n=1 Tax=Vigna mungo TaxID=3915 RepID=A0AAQ3RMW4_VIGMU
MKKEGMAGKSSKGRNKKGSHHASSTSEPAVHSDLPVKNNLEGTLESAKADVAEAEAEAIVDSVGADPELKEHETTTEGSQQKQGEMGQGRNCIAYRYNDIIVW